jgi:hypothetical protein
MPQVESSAVIVALSYVAVAIVVVFMTDPRTLTALYHRRGTHLSQTWPEFQRDNGSPEEITL